MRALKWIGASALALFLLLLLFFAFGLSLLKGPVGKAVTSATGREFVIEGDFRPVWSWVHPRLRAERVRFANPEWASEELMFQAEAVEASIALLPLLAGRVVLPEVHLVQPVVNLEIDEQGRKNWLLERDQKKEEGSRVQLQMLTLDRGRLRFDDAGRDISLQTELSSDADGLSVRAKGVYHGLPASAEGRGGQVLAIKDTAQPYPLEAAAKVGDTTLKAKGTITNVAQVSAMDLAIEVSGTTMSELYDVIGIAFPETSPYTTRGRLVRGDKMVRYEKFTGKVGESDLAGTLQFDTGGKRVFMHGQLDSRVLNLADLGSLVGTGQATESGGVLPEMPFDSDRWDSLDADVRIQAGSIRRPKQLPLENLVTRIRMRDKVLTLEPFEVGVAGGKIAGTIRLDGQKEPIAAATTLRVRELSLPKLFPTIKESQGSIGDINGLIELTGRGNSVGEMLGSASGKLGAFIDGGKISRLMMQFVALDLWGVAKVKLQGDEPVDIRCAIADFVVKDGVMRTNAFVFDTQVVNVGAEGDIDLKKEALNLTLKPEPKDRSIASLNSPLYIRGTLGAPKVAPDWNRVGVRGLGAIVMGALSPILAVLPLFEEGRDKDSPCAQLIAQATKKTRSPRQEQEQAAARAKAEKAQEARNDKRKDERRAERNRPAAGGTRQP